ncbi:MAG: hypothetical protein LV481_07415 [Methylacidiphilales bacterium]|nr:hypothetical protein [Candidatus Methylacidiphilales bacterium]
MSTLYCSLLSLGCAAGYAPPADTTLTALRALKIAQRRLRPEVRAKLLSISSARTDATFVSEIWRFVFLDKTTSGHARAVIVAAKTSSEHPDTAQAFSSAKSENLASLLAIPQNKLLFDSDKMLERVRQTSKLKGLKSAEYRLIQSTSGREPMWCLSFYAESPEPIVSFRVDAATGAIQLGGSTDNAD